MCPCLVLSTPSPVLGFMDTNTQFLSPLLVAMGISVATVIRQIRTTSFAQGQHSEISHLFYFIFFNFKFLFRNLSLNLEEDAM